MKMIGMFAEALVTTIAVPAFGMDHAQTNLRKKQAVLAAAKRSAIDFNACISRKYVAGCSRAADKAMGRYRDT